MSISPYLTCSTSILIWQKDHISIWIYQGQIYILSNISFDICRIGIFKKYIFDKKNLYMHSMWWQWLNPALNSSIVIILHEKTIMTSSLSSVSKINKNNIKKQTFLLSAFIRCWSILRQGNVTQSVITGFFICIPIRNNLITANNQ